MIGALLLLLGIGGCSGGADPAPQWSGQAVGDDLSFSPRTYALSRTTGPIEVDGRLAESDWGAVPWTADFVDIRGGDAPTPRFRTRAKMLWDDEALYVAAELEEPDVWGTLTQRDTVIFYDNDFEVFLDPTGTTHNYYELEVNALETAWDLFLPKPYRDGGPPLDGWDIQELEVGVHVDGTLNNPSDTDEGWTVEIAMPWDVLKEAAPEERPPRAGEQWRINFSRVQWPVEVVDGAYRKVVDTTEAHSEDNWVWSPQGVIDMHRPEQWGIVEFADVPAGSGSVDVRVPSTTRIKWALRRLYYRQRQYREATGHYASSLSILDADDIELENRSFEPTLRTTQSTYEITAPGPQNTTVHIRSDGKTWTTAE